MQDFEKLGVFYLGRLYDLAAAKPKDELLLYDSKDLVTHAVCVGMTGSGKTGLCLSLIEEAAIDGIPAIVIDPKGDLPNLLLTFPGLRGEDFEPWVDEEDARKKGLAVKDFAQQQADLWKKGLADWGQDGARIQRLRDAADFAVYTPGSNAGIPVSVLKSFAAPEPALREDAELFRDRVSVTATSLLGLLNIQADPIQGREHILLATILSAAWQEGKDLDLGALIQQIQSPPVTRIGVMDLESFYPAKDRFGLAMALNNLLASPGFEAWLEGEPLDVAALLHTKTGKPRVSIFSIAHLGDAERMFVVSLLLNQVLSWVRTQPGTTSLRALVYMDEIFGYFPPVANPPSKLPLLTLLKQARAFGLGVVLATQNPVDLDYKGLANAGTWFIGRLQTERDKARVLEGLEGASTTAGQKFDRQQMERALASLGNRVFLMNNVHDDAPVVFQVRWAMSYLRGPLTRGQIKTLMEGRKGAAGAATSQGDAPIRPAPTAAAAAGQRPVLPPEVPQVFLPLRGRQPAEAQLVYRPMLLGLAKVFFTDPKAGVDFPEEAARLAEFAAGAVTVDWQEAESIDLNEDDLEKEPGPSARFAAPPPEAAKAKSYDGWKKAFADTLFRIRKLEIFKSPGLEEFSKPGESERDFRVRLQQAAREQRDQLAAQLKEKYAPKLAALQERIRRAGQAVDREQEQATQSKFSTAISFGATVLGALFGRKKLTATNIGKAATTARSVGRSMKESSDVGRAQDTVEAMKQQLADLETKFQEEVAALDGKIDPLTEKLETIAVKPKKTNITVKLTALAWAPYWEQKDGTAAKAWE